MKNRKIQFRLEKAASHVWGCLLFLAVWLPGTQPVYAQNVPIHIEAPQTIYDQFGKPLSRENGGDFVQVLLVNGQVFPPDADGQPHTNNPVCYTCRIGQGVLIHTSTVGRFSVALADRASEAQIFARVWNGPSLEASSFYKDSQIFTPNFGAVFYPVIEATTIPLDPADDDEDGLNNSMEKDLGSDKNNQDTDGDGILDFAEFRSGTELTNNLSYLAMVEIIPDDWYSDIFQVQWSAVDGKSYQLQYTTQELQDPNVSFIDINSIVTATGDVAFTTVTNNIFEEIKSFRVRLVE